MCTNCTPTGLVDSSSDGVDVLTNDIEEGLAEIEIKKNLLQGLYRLFLVFLLDFPQNYFFFCFSLENTYLFPDCSQKIYLFPHFGISNLNN